MTPTEELRKRLDELCVEYDTFDTISTQNTYWNVGELRYRYCGRKDSMTELTMFAKCGLTPEQVISATVGGTVCEPSKEWKAWYESLKHDNPSNVLEAVENILFDAIDFGSNMGPNGNVWSGVDEGDVLTKKCIDGWVRSIESVAATAGVDSNTGEVIRKLLDKLNTELCNAGCVIECETREERQRLIDAVKDKYAQAIAAMVGAEKLDTSELWPEWEQVLFANVSDEVAQDNLNECVHELLDKAATVGEECEMHICKRCGVAYELNIIDKGFGKPRFCPNCGYRQMYQ